MILLCGISLCVLWVCFHSFFHVVFLWFCSFYPYVKLLHFKDSKIQNSLPAEALIFKGQTLITLKLNPSNGHDYVDIWEACFYTNTPDNLRGSDRSNASEACDDPGNVSKQLALYYSIYVSQTLWLLGSAPSHWSGSKGRWLDRVSQSLGNATVSATHSASARLTQLLPVVMETLRLPAPEDNSLVS